MTQDIFLFKYNTFRSFGHKSVYAVYFKAMFEYHVILIHLFEYNSVKTIYSRKGSSIDFVFMLSNGL